MDLRRKSAGLQMRLDCPETSKDKWEDMSGHGQEAQVNNTAMSLRHGKKADWKSWR